MKAIIFKVLSKGLLILFLLALFALYHYRAVLFPQWFGATPASAAADVSTNTQPGAVGKQAQTNATPSGSVGPDIPATTGPTPQPVSEAPLGTSDTIHSDESRPAATDVMDVTESPLAESNGSVAAPAEYRAVAGAAPAPVVEDVTSPVSAQADTTAQYGSQAGKPMNMDAPAGFLPPGVDSALADDQGKAASIPPTPALPQETNKADVAVKAEPAPLANAPLPESKTTVVSSQPDDINMLLKQARDAYWQGDYTKARLAYQKVIALADDSDPAPYGELGNVYFAQKDLSAAAEAYSEAAYRLLAQGRVNEASHLLLVLKGLDEDKALELQHLIEQYQARD